MRAGASAGRTWGGAAARGRGAAPGLQPRGGRAGAAAAPGGDARPCPLSDKPGECPKVRPAGQCGEECSADTQCPRGQRCARTGCGRVCVDPVLCLAGGAGACPVPGGRGTCLDLCSSDEECPWGQKCCSNGCGRVCTPVRPVPSRSRQQ
uniref:WAP domain-containing protein n=1 Tax=Dromaius novaehollandiae TaxID=8790 RepID=A0A8C4JKI2_DRONO